MATEPPEGQESDGERTVSEKEQSGVHILSERMLPPKEVEWSVEEREGMVQISLITNSREVNDRILLEKEPAQELLENLDSVVSNLPAER